MESFVKLGKRRTILVSISILLVSVHTIYFYHVIRPEINITKLFQQIIRFILTVGLLYALYKGKRWARVLLIILLSLTVILTIFSILNLEGTIEKKVPLISMAIVYTYSIFHFAFSKSYKAFIEHQNNKDKNI